MRGKEKINKSSLATIIGHESEEDYDDKASEKWPQRRKDKKRASMQIPNSIFLKESTNSQNRSTISTINLHAADSVPSLRTIDEMRRQPQPQQQTWRYARRSLASKVKQKQDSARQSVNIRPSETML